MMLLILCANFPVNAFADTLSVDLKANGQDALTLATSTDSFTVSLSAPGATACQMTVPAASGVDVAMSSVIAPGHPWYPAVGGSTTFTVTCTNGVNNLSDTVVVSLPAASAPVVVPPVASSTPLTADIKVNGSDGPVVTLTSGQSYTYTWSSTNATACQLTSPAASGISTSGSSAAISAGHPWYPSNASASTSVITLAITCTDGVTNASDQVKVQLNDAVTPPPTGGSPVTADIKANGSDGPVVTIASGTPYTYSWSSTNATACQLTSPAASGISISGTSASIAPGHPWYPTSASSTVLSITCTDGVTNASDTVTVALAASAPSGGSSPVTADIKINGSDGPVTINNGDAYTYSWSSTNATACQLTSPAASGISTNGTSASITPGHPFYPSVGGSTTFTILCTNGLSNATDTAVVNIAPVTPPAVGGGSSTPPPTSSTGGSSTPPSSSGSSVPPVAVGASCLYIKDYMRADFQNDPVEVLKLQAFLKIFEGYNLDLTGVYDQGTINAVNAFQLKYRADILDPWGLTGPTGYTYILTLKKVNELYCEHVFPLNEAQANEIQAFHDLVTGLRAQGINVVLPGSTVLVPVTTQVLSSTTVATSTPITVPIVGVSTTTNSQGQNSTNLAAVLFAAPKTVMDGLQCLYEFLLILIVLYIIGSVLEDVLYKKEDLTAFRKRFYTKWTAISVGLIVAGIIAYILNEWCLILPLLIALVLSLAWMALYPKHNHIKDGARAWYLAMVTRAKSPFKKKTVVTTTTTAVEKKA
ncbi:MAG: secreted agglutinin [Parcubacteria group bacterium]|nr:secreted agglutinin [Parcubacteria group bacterium]